ncbi:MAG: hypothetical protein HXY25_01170 [Alphaproteobacteria bacterium]|nr:hypothetical protein [Alphaproteobacteria bacterium]
MTPAGAAPPSPDSTELERRVLAHERILQSLIAYMSRTEPRFVDHLRERFVEPMKMACREQDYRNVDDYADEFIRAIMLMGETRPSAASDQGGHGTPAPPNGTREPARRPSSPPDGIEMRETSGIWHVIVDGMFWGDFHRREQALAAMALAKLSLR